jgi:hypothetical protein
VEQPHGDLIQWLQYNVRLKKKKKKFVAMRPALAA